MRSIYAYIWCYLEAGCLQARVNIIASPTQPTFKLFTNMKVTNSSWLYCNVDSSPNIHLTWHKVPAVDIDLFLLSLLQVWSGDSNTSSEDAVDNLSRKHPSSCGGAMLLTLDSDGFLCRVGTCIEGGARTTTSTIYTISRDPRLIRSSSNPIQWPHMHLTVYAWMHTMKYGISIVCNHATWNLKHSASHCPPPTLSSSFPWASMMLSTVAYQSCGEDIENMVRHVALPEQVNMRCNSMQRDIIETPKIILAMNLVH